MNAPAPADPGSLTDLLFGTYRDHIPARNKDAFYAIFDASQIPRAHPDNPRESNPHPQWIMDALDKLDALLDPHRPLSEEARKARGAIRLACMVQLSKLLRERLRQEARDDLPL